MCSVLIWKYRLVSQCKLYKVYTNTNILYKHIYIIHSSKSQVRVHCIPCMTLTLLWVMTLDSFIRVSDVRCKIFGLIKIKVDSWSSSKFMYSMQIKQDLFVLYLPVLFLLLASHEQLHQLESAPTENMQEPILQWWHWPQNWKCVTDPVLLRHINRKARPTQTPVSLTQFYSTEELGQMECLSLWPSSTQVHKQKCSIYMGTEPASFTDPVLLDRRARPNGMLVSWRVQSCCLFQTWGFQ